MFLALMILLVWLLENVHFPKGDEGCKTRFMPVLCYFSFREGWVQYGLFCSNQHLVVVKWGLDLLNQVFLCSHECGHFYMGVGQKWVPKKPGLVKGKLDSIQLLSPVGLESF